MVDVALVKIEPFGLNKKIIFDEFFLPRIRYILAFWAILLFS